MTTNTNPCNEHDGAIPVELCDLTDDQARGLASECGRAFGAMLEATGQFGRLMAATDLTEAHGVVLHAFGKTWQELETGGTAALDIRDPRTLARAIDARHRDGRVAIDQFADAFSQLGVTEDHHILLTGYAMTVAAIEDKRSAAIADLLGLSGDRPSALH